MSGPMDPKLLARCRRDRSVLQLNSDVLLAAHDHWRRQAPVTAKDVEREGISRTALTTWLTEHDWSETGETVARDGALPHGRARLLTVWSRHPGSLDKVHVPTTDAAKDMLAALRACARYFGRTVRAILDEMETP